MIDQRKALRVHNKIQREQEAKAKKLAAQEAREAKQAERQIQNDLKNARKTKQNRNNNISIAEEAAINARGAAEAQGVPLAT